MKRLILTELLTLVTHSKVGHDLGKLTLLSGAERIRHLSRQMSDQSRGGTPK